MAALGGWFADLSEPTQRVLTDRTSRLVVLWPDGRLVYRSGSPSAGLRYAIQTASVAPADYELLRRKLSERWLVAFMASVEQSTHRGATATEPYLTMYRALDEPDVPRRDRLLAMLGEQLTHLPPGARRRIAQADPDMFDEAVLAFQRVHFTRIARIQGDQDMIAQVSGGDADLLAAISEAADGGALARLFPSGAEEAEQATELDGERVLPLELTGETHGYLGIASDVDPSDLSSPDALASLIQEGRVRVFVANIGSDDVRLLQAADVAAAVRGGVQHQ